VEGFLDEVGADRAALVASSSAAFTVQRIAAASPRRVLGLVLIGGPWSLADVPAAHELLAVVSELSDPVDRRFVERFVRDTASAAVPRDLVERMTRESQKLPARVWRQALEGLLRETPVCTTVRLEVPTLLLWGDRDPFVPRSDTERLLAELPRSRLAVYEGSGHMVHWEEPARVAADLAGFVAELGS